MKKEISRYVCRLTLRKVPLAIVNVDPLPLAPAPRLVCCAHLSALTICAPVTLCVLVAFTFSRKRDVGSHAS
jgi:hypothetical protein